MTKPQNIAAIIVTFQSYSTIQRCVLALSKSTEISEICIVDNASSDKTIHIVEQLAATDHRIQIICNKHNVGFAKACNQGADATSAPWIVFINPDALVEAKILPTLLQHAQALEPAILGVEQIDLEGKTDPAVRRKEPEFAKMLYAPWQYMRLAVEKQVDKDIQDVPALSGAFLCMSRKTLLEIGGWDSQYTLHAEDLDLCKRAHLHGVRVAILNKIHITHIRGVSSKSHPFFVEWHKHRGLWRYFCKYQAKSHSHLVCFAVWLAIWLHAGIKALRQCVLRH